MRFYEEFGLAHDASAEQIKESYRTLVRLLHPDQHADPGVKLAAERQMRRINHIYAVLSDPERRRRYDVESREPERLPVIVPPVPPPRGMRYTGFVWGAAAVAICGFVLWLAGRDSSYTPQDSAMANEPAAQAVTARQPEAPVSKLEEERPSAPVAVKPSVTRRDMAALKTVPLSRAAAGEAPKAAVPVVPSTLPGAEAPKPAEQSAVREPMALPAPEPARATRPEPVPPAHFAGAWFYPHSNMANKNPALYPPEYIETMITEEHGTVHGRYRARYVVPDRAISPDVVFQFDGHMTAPVANLTWTGAGGAHGLIHLKLISENAMEVQWSASDRGNGMGLVSGTAVLRRRAD